VIRRRFDDVLNAGNLKLLDGLIATRYVEHNRLGLLRELGVAP
jgi:hypothetical protein